MLSRIPLISKQLCVKSQGILITLYTQIKRILWYCIVEIFICFLAQYVRLRSCDLKSLHKISPHQCYDSPWALQIVTASSRAIKLLFFFKQVFWLWIQRVVAALAFRQLVISKEVKDSSLQSTVCTGSLHWVPYLLKHQSRTPVGLPHSVIPPHTPSTVPSLHCSIPPFLHREGHLFLLL